MIDDARTAAFSNFEQKATNVWKVSCGGQFYGIKIEKKTFHTAGGKTDLRNRDQWENRLTDLNWAIELFMEICKNDRVHPWCRALLAQEMSSLWGRLPGDTTPPADRPHSLVTIADWVSDLTAFGDCLDPAKSRVMISLRALLGGDPPSLAALGRGLAVDLFLGNNDRVAYEPNASSGLFFNMDNFFLQTPVGGPNSILYIDFWDPNSQYNSKNNFPTQLGPEYLGPLMGTKSGQTELANSLAATIQRVLKISGMNVKKVAEGIKSGAADLGAYLRKDKANPHIRRRLAACKIKV